MSVLTPNIAIVGRPNVGKSTLFNRILGQRKAIVEDFPGVTRDRLYAFVERFSIPFLLVDTGGITDEPENDIEREVVAQTLLAAEEADIVLCLFDGASGYHDADRAVVDMLRRRNKPVVYAVNKCDGAEQFARVVDFYQLGVDELNDISALHGRKVDQLVEAVLKTLPSYELALQELKLREERIQKAQEEASRIAAEFDAQEETEHLQDDEEYEPYIPDEDEEERMPRFAPVYLPGEETASEVEYDREHGTLALDESKPSMVRTPAMTWQEALSKDDREEAEEEIVHSLENIRVSVVGRPNVGKSTLLNTLVGERRAITSPVAGTTRDSLDVEIKRDGQKFVIVDTAGLRKKGKIEENSIERFSALRSLGALSACDVAVVVLDASEGLTDQDEKIAGLAHEQGKGLVIAVNKWDLVEKDHKTVHAFTKRIREMLRFAPYAPIIFLSALSGRRCPKVLDEVKKVALERTKRISTRQLNQTLEQAIRRKALPMYRGRPLKLYYAVQVDSCPPRIALFFNYPKEVHFSYFRYLKNTIRDEFGFEGTDVKLMARRR